MTVEKPLIIPFFLNQEGCYRRCIFCNQHVITGFKPAEDLPSGLEEIVANYLATVLLPAVRKVQIAFYGGSFTSLQLSRQNEYLCCAQQFIRRGLVHSLRLSTRPDSLDETTCQRLKNFGVKTVELGVQSLDNRVLATCNRGHDAATVVATTQLLKSLDFETGVQLMLGLPGQSRKSFLETVKKTITIGPDFVRIYPAVVLCHTPWAACLDNEGYHPLPLTEAVEWCAEALCIFKTAGVPVIRMGLHPSESLLAPGNIIAGPYHPAFGELVKSYLFREKVIDILGKGVLDKQSRSEKGQRISVSVGLHKADVSAFVGHQRSNLGEYYRRLKDIDIGWHIDHRQHREEFSCATVQGRLVDHCSVFD
jgi:histone acetyltransferase (RNA polymerase elongator complex component)